MKKPNLEKPIPIEKRAARLRTGLRAGSSDIGKPPPPPQPGGPIG